MKTFKWIGAVACVIILAAAGLQAKKLFKPNYIPEGERGMVGATVPVVVSIFETSLQSSITSTANSMTLVSGTDRAGTSLSGYECFTIDEGTTVAEFTCGTASGTSVTNLTRGISPTTGTSSVTSLKFAHRRGASVKITNYPQLAITSRILNGDETLPNPLRYDSTVSTSTLANNSLYLASVGYVNGVALAGAPNATTSVQGVVQFATGAQLSSGILQGSTGSYLVPGNSYFTSTPGSSTTVPVTLASGKLAQGFLDLTQGFTWTGLQVFNSATTTLNATTSIAASASNKLLLNSVAYVLPSTQGAASTTLVNNGSGTLSWQTTPQYATSTNTAVNSTWNSTTATSTVTSFTFTPSSAGRLLIIFSASSSNDTSAGGCSAQLFIDNVSQIIASYKNGNTTATQQGNLSFSYVTSVQTAAQHTYTVSGLSVAGGTCTLLTPGPHMSIISLGN